MVRIRVKITRHDGASKKETVWKGLHQAKAFVYKVVQSKDAFYLITDNEQAELILKDHVKQFWRENGLEVQTPLELVASRTVLVRGLEWCVAERSENDIKSKIEAGYSDWQIERVIKIPNNDKAMKVICANVRTSDDILDKGMVLYNQRFSGRSFEREMYINITPCFKCYKYDHITKKCQTPEGYKVCSEYSRQGHRFNECSSQIKKCLNCGQPHKTLAFKCPVRKESVKKKLGELKQRKQEKIPEATLRNVVAKQMQEDLPPNYLTVIASAIMIANIREQEYPATVVAGYQHHVKKKRGRETLEEEQVMEAEEGAVGGTLNKERYSQSMLDLLALPAEMPAPTPSHTPASTPAGTPVQYPARVSKEDKGGMEIEPTKKKKRDDDPGVILITYKGSNVPQKKMTHSAKLNFLQRSGILKYIFQNKMYSREKVKEFVNQKKVDLGNVEMFRVDKAQFDSITMGQHMHLQFDK